MSISSLNWTWQFICSLSHAPLWKWNSQSHQISSGMTRSVKKIYIYTYTHTIAITIFIYLYTKCWLLPDTWLIWGLLDLSGGCGQWSRPSPWVLPPEGQVRSGRTSCDFLCARVWAAATAVLHSHCFRPLAMYVFIYTCWWHTNNLILQKILLNHIAYLIYCGFDITTKIHCTIWK